MAASYTKPLLAKPTSQQIEHRRDIVVEMTLDPAGYWLDQIAAALRVQKSTITADRAARAYQLRSVIRRGRKGKRRPPDPEPRDWTVVPVPATPYPTGPVPRLEATLAYLRESNARNRFAHNVEEAVAAGDNVFFMNAQVKITTLIDYLQDMLEIAQDGDARRLAATSREARDDLASKREPSPYSNVPRSLPPAGQGQRPGRIFGELWGYRYAGFWPLSDEQVMKMAARSGGTERVPNPTRVRQAIAELDAYWDSADHN